MTSWARRRTTRRAGIALCLGLAAAGCNRRSGWRLTDLGPRTGWQVSRGSPIAARTDGRMSLLADGGGDVTKQITLDVDAYPLLLVRTAQTLPRATWSVWVRAAGDTSPILLLRKHAEEGAWIVHLRAATGWRGVVTFTLGLGLEGRRGDWVELADLAAARVTAAPPAAPRLSWPAPRETVSPGAVHYEWHQVLNAVGYDLEVSATAAFTGARPLRVEPPYLADQLPYLPTDSELPGPGVWHWRVRGIGDRGRPGPWSSASTFTVRSAPSPARPPARAVSAADPLVVLYADPHRLPWQWAALPGIIRQHAVMRVEALPSESLETAAARAARERIPIVIQLSGPHDYYGPPAVASRISLSEVEHLFRRYPNIQGAYLCEQAFRVAPERNRIMLDYARRLIPLAARYGKLVLWADAHWGRNLWIDVGLDRALMDTIRAYPRTLIPIWKMNGALTPFSAHDAVFGLWASGAVAHWGVQPEGYYWYEAGLKAPEVSGWFKEGDRADLPPSYYAVMTLLGLSGGASVYSYEPGTDIWEPSGALTVYARYVTLPLLEQVITHRLVPDPADVLAGIRVAYVADSADSPWALDYGSMAPLYAGGYGVSFPFANIPETSRYYWIPILPRWTPPAALARWPPADRLSAATLRDSARVHRYLDARYPPQPGDQAWVARVGRVVVVLSTSENGTGDETYRVRVGDGSTASGSVGPDGWVLLTAYGDTTLVLAGARPASLVPVDLQLPGAPGDLTRTPATAAAGWTYDRSQRLLQLRLAISDGGTDGVWFVVPRATR